MLQNAFLLSIIGFDTSESEPSKILQNVLQKNVNSLICPPAALAALAILWLLDWLLDARRGVLAHAQREIFGSPKQLYVPRGTALWTTHFSPEKLRSRRGRRRFYQKKLHRKAFADI